MKKILLAIWLSITVFALAFVVGCSSTSNVAFKSEQTADISVTAAMTAWGDYVKANRPPVAQELQVRALFNKYQATQLLLIDSTKALADAASATNSAGVVSAQSVITVLSSQLSGELSDLVSLVQSFGVKIP